MYSYAIRTAHGLLTYLLTYLLTPWSRVLLEKLIGSAGSQEIPVVCFLLGDSPASDLYMPTFRNTVSVPSSKAGVGIYKSEAGESPKRKQTTF